MSSIEVFLIFYIIRKRLKKFTPEGYLLTQSASATISRISTAESVSLLPFRRQPNGWDLGFK